MQTPDDSEKSPYAGLAHKIRGGKSASLVDYETRPPSITVSRALENTVPGSALLGGIPSAIASEIVSRVKLIAFVVELDGQIIGKLWKGDRVTVDLSPGGHTLRITSPTSRSKPETLFVENGQRVKFSCCSWGLTTIRLQRQH